MSTSPVKTATFQQHMMTHSPSPLITPSQSPYIVQPISRAKMDVGFDIPDRKEDLSHSFSTGLSFGSVPPESVNSSPNMDTSYY